MHNIGENRGDYGRSQCGAVPQYTAFTDHLVFGKPKRNALAQSARALPCLGVRDYAPATENGGGHRVLSAVHGSLSDGSEALVSGVKQLNDGSLALNTGLKTYKEQGVKALVDAVDGDVKGLVNRLKAISKVSSRYKSFSGISDDMDGKVDFIYKTESIE